MAPKRFEKVIKPLLSDKPRLARISAVVNFIAWALLLVVYCTTFLEDLRGPLEVRGHAANESQMEDIQRTNYVVETIREHNKLNSQLLIYFGVVTLVGIAGSTVLISGLQQESYIQCKLWLITATALFVSDLVMTQVATALQGPAAFLILKQFCNLASLFCILFVWSYMRVKHYKWPHPIPEVVIVDCEEGCVGGTVNEGFYGVVAMPVDGVTSSQRR